MESWGGGGGSPNPDPPRLQKQHKRFLKFHFEFVYTPVVPTKTILDSRPIGQSLYQFSDQNDAKTVSNRAADTYYGLYKGITPPGHNTPLAGTRWKDLQKISPLSAKL